MVNYFIYAKDFSYSTNSCKYYHTNGLKTLEQFQCDVQRIKEELKTAGEPDTESKIIYLHWGASCEEVDEDTTKTTYLAYLGNHGATRPYEIIDWLKQNYDICVEGSKIKLLYIITDGLIDNRDADKCFDMNENMFYETVVFHAFHENPDNIDLSVASSFFKNNCKVYRNYKLCDCINVLEEFDYGKINADNYRNEKENMISYIKLKFIKNCKPDARALQEIEKLKKLRSRLFDELSSKEVNEINLETKDKSVFLREFVRTEWYMGLVGAEHNMKVDVEKCITTLINYIISDTKSYSFDALKFDMKFSKPVDEELIVDVNFPVEQEIAFPDIILDDEKGIPVVILTDLNLLDKIIFHGNHDTEQSASFNKFKSTMECPLFLIEDKDISESIGYFYTLNVYKQFLANNTRNEPRTRKPFHGGLVLTDTDEFDKYNDYILSATYFDSKKVNFNVGLFYYVLWKNCENKEWMDRNVVERFKKYTMRRIGKTVCKIGLSSLPLDPQEKTSLPTALWYCVELSSYIFKDDPENFTQERLRMFSGIAQYMIEILKCFDYDLDLKSINRRRELLSYVMILKRIPKRRDKIYYILERIFKTVNGFLVSEIEKPFNLYKLNYLKLNHKGLLRDNVVEETVHLYYYVHLMHMETSEVGEGTFEICKKTFRPFFAINQSKSFYTELFKNTKKAVINNDYDKDKVNITFEPIDSLEFDRILSFCNLFIQCVKDLEKYPTLPEYVDYISKKKKFHEDLVTIFPPNVYSEIKYVYDCYQKIVNNVEVSKFIEVCRKTVGRFERIKVEERVKFEYDDVINEYISSEESKVNLKKKS